MGNYSRSQARFYDTFPPLTPFSKELVNSGLRLTYKPREIFWKKHLDSLGFKKGSSVLDVGCGQGVLLARIVKHYGLKGMGTDVSSKSISYAKSNFGGKNLRFIQADATKLPFIDNSFDYLVSFDVLEHIDKQNLAVFEMARLVKKGGRILVYTLQKNYRYTLDWVWQCLGFDIFSRAAHKKELLVDIQKLVSLFKANGMKVEKVELFDAFFTLGLDEAIMVLFSVTKNLGIKNDSFLNKLLLNMTCLLSRLLYMSLNLVDRLWYKKNKSLSFIFIAEK